MVGQIVLVAAAIHNFGIDTVQVHLMAPLGCRVLFDENGNVGSACPENKAARR
ncbi:MAG: hypothetical protein M3069_18030 [Chloroflexota bacterium]|nr:hypothetical protein [Chloroflexota bacterium]